MERHDMLLKLKALKLQGMAAARNQPAPTLNRRTKPSKRTPETPFGPAQFYAITPAPVYVIIDRRAASAASPQRTS